MGNDDLAFNHERLNKGYGHSEKTGRKTDKDGYCNASQQ